MKKWWLLIIVSVLLGVAWLIFSNKQSMDAPQDTQEQTQQSEAPQQQSEPPALAFDNERLSAALSQWSLTAASAGVVLASSDNTIATLNPEKQFFGASLYKLYVAYLGYGQLDRAEFDANEIYLNGQTRLQCLDAMIRTSDSPCAEKWWNEYGKVKATEDLRKLGLQQTDMESLLTSAADAANMLRLIMSGEGLSDASQKALLTSMREQIYTATFNQVFTQQTVYNKIGFRDYDEYHDVAIVEFSDGRKLIVAALTDGVGTKGLRNLGQAILQATGE